MDAEHVVNLQQENVVLPVDIGEEFLFTTKEIGE